VKCKTLVVECQKTAQSSAGRFEFESTGGPGHVCPDGKSVFFLILVIEVFLIVIEDVFVLLVVFEVFVVFILIFEIFVVIFFEIIVFVVEIFLFFILLVERGHQRGIEWLPAAFREKLRMEGGTIQTFPVLRFKADSGRGGSAAGMPGNSP
jgi:hypothetical protein